MSKIIIHNDSSKHDSEVLRAVSHVCLKGFTSGDNQYCWHVFFPSMGIGVSSMKTRGETHTFKVKDEAMQ